MPVMASHNLLLGGSFSRKISAYWRLVGTGMHRTFRGANIIHDKRRESR